MPDQIDRPQPTIAAQRRFNRRSTLRTGTPRCRKLAMSAVLLSLLLPMQMMNANGEDVSDSEMARHPYEGFTQPIRTIHVATGDSGRVADVRVRDGESVDAGQLLLELDYSILAASREVVITEANSTARIEALRVEHQVKARRLRKFQQLEADGLGSPEELIRAEADEQIAHFNLQFADEERKTNQLRIKEFDARIRSRQVYSPIAGIVFNVKRDLGEYVSPADPDVITVVDLSELRAVFYIPAVDATQYQTDDSVSLLLRDTGQQVKGVVEYISPIVKADSGRVEIRVLIDNEKRQFKSGLRCLLKVASSRRETRQTRSNSERSGSNK